MMDPQHASDDRVRPGAGAARNEFRQQGASMTQAWIILTSPDGKDIAAPTETQLAATLAEIYALRKKAADTEPATAALRFGYDDDLMYVAEVSSTGEVSFEEWSDRDCELALAAPRHMRANQSEALQLWSWLARRQVAKIRELAWQS
jgi:hypothetical protein